MPSQPSKRGSSSSSVQHLSPPACSSRCRPCTLSDPHAKQLCGSMTILLPPIRTSSSVTRRSDVKVAHLAGLGLDEVLARLHALTHEHREDAVGDGRVL